MALANQPATRQAAETLALARQFAAGEAALSTSLARQLQELTAHEPGRIALWGAGAKAVTFANLVDLDGRWIACVVVVNPAKQGLYIPGTGHPIIDYAELLQYGVPTAGLLNPNYYRENLTLLQATQIDVRLLNLMS